MSIINKPRWARAASLTTSTYIMQYTRRYVFGPGPIKIYDPEPHAKVGAQEGRRQHGERWKKKPQERRLHIFLAIFPFIVWLSPSRIGAAALCEMQISRLIKCRGRSSAHLNIVAYSLFSRLERRVFPRSGGPTGSRGRPRSRKKAMTAWACVSLCV